MVYENNYTCMYFDIGEKCWWCCRIADVFLPQTQSHICMCTNSNLLHPLLSSVPSMIGGDWALWTETIQCVPLTLPLSLSQRTSMTTCCRRWQSSDREDASPSSATTTGRTAWWAALMDFYCWDASIGLGKSQQTLHSQDCFLSFPLDSSITNRHKNAPFTALVQFSMF